MRKLIPTVLLLFSGFFIQAQVKGFIGVKGGANLSFAYIEHTLPLQLGNARTTFIPGYHAGVMLKLFTNQTSSLMNAGLQVSPGYTRRGWKQTFETDEPSVATRMGYLELPMEALAYFGHRRIKFFFTVGMYLDYLVSVDTDDPPDSTNLGGGMAYYPYVEERDRKFGYGARGSLGVQREFGFGTLHLDAYFSFGIRSFMEHGTFDSGVPDLSNHFAGGFTLAYLIPFGSMDF